MPSNFNPSFYKKQKQSFTLNECLSRIHDDRNVLSYLISLAESTLPPDQSFLSEFFHKSGAGRNSTRRIAVSGAPGVGKSTFLDSLGHYLVSTQKRVAILPVDPTSTRSKGSILGDKTRMSSLVSEENAFVRPMASSLALGGVAPATDAAISLCELAGFDYVFVETVGVGQSEYEVRHLVDLFFLLLLPGGGDDLQGIKRGIIEMADILVINKADGDMKQAAEITRKAHRTAQTLMRSNEWNWKPKVTVFSSISSGGEQDLLACIDSFYDHMGSNLDKLRQQQASLKFTKSVKEMAYQHYLSTPSFKKINDTLQEKLHSGELAYWQALSELKKTLENSEA